MSISRLSEKCSKCPHVNTCSNKRMEACAVADMTSNNAINLNNAVNLNDATNLNSVSQQNNKSRTIKISYEVPKGVNAEEIAKRILASNCMFER